MRRDLLLLSDPKQRLSELLPGDAFLASDAGLQDGSSSSSGEVSKLMVQEMSGMLCLQHLMLLHASVYGSSDDCSSADACRLALSRPALQLTAELLLLAAAHWQQLYHSLTGRQQWLLNKQKAQLARDEKVGLKVLRSGKLAAAQDLLVFSMQLLRKQVTLLWGSGQWQPQMQLLQQGSGEVLLQGLILAVHCCGLDVQLCQHEAFESMSEMLSMLADYVTGESLKPAGELGSCCIAVPQHVMCCSTPV
jgi:hypothetical protein